MGGDRRSGACGGYQGNAHLAGCETCLRVGGLHIRICEQGEQTTQAQPFLQALESAVARIRWLQSYPDPCILASHTSTVATWFLTSLKERQL